MAANDIHNVVESLMSGMEGFLSTKTVVGEATVVGDVIILPLVDVSFGVGAGASMKENKSNGGGGGMTGKMSPSAVLVIKDGQTKLVNIKNQDTVTKLIDMVPDLIDKFTNKGSKDDIIDDETAKEVAFPEEKEE